MTTTLFKSKEDIQVSLNVSLATVNNWIKTGSIPKPTNQNGYTSSEFNQIIKMIKSSDSNRLKGRANRSMIDSKYICYLGLSNENVKSQLLRALDIHMISGSNIEKSILSLSIAILKSHGLLSEQFLTQPATKIEEFISFWIIEKGFNSENVIKIFEDFQLEYTSEDFLGAFYQSVQSISSKSKLGAFYTPSVLLEDIQVPLQKTVLDPCCGSGGILLNVLNKNHDSSLIHAWDIDELALKICRVNLCLFFNDPNSNPNIKKYDSIFQDKYNFFDLQKTQFDFIITNPPWGSKYSRNEKGYLLKKYPSLKTTESFSIILYNSIVNLAESGTLIFFLPHSFFNVSTHANIRKFLIDNNISFNIKLLGNAFKGVMSEAIRLEIYNEKRLPPKIMVYSEKGNSTILKYENLKEPDYIIPATASNSCLDLISKVYKKEHYLLRDNAKFALGIVTGNNSKYLLKDATKNTEPIFRGKDISPFRLNSPDLHIDFNPDIYQQVAPVDLYRQPKIAYRFISDKIVCVLDSEKRLFLNSANFFIPTLDYPFETIALLFNSKLYTYIYRKMFYSKKVLRNHIESFPLPKISGEEHAEIKLLHDMFVTNTVDFCQLDRVVYSLFNLNHEEINLIEGNV